VVSGGSFVLVSLANATSDLTAQHRGPFPATGSVASILLSAPQDRRHQPGASAPSSLLKGPYRPIVARPDAPGIATAKVIMLPRHDKDCDAERRARELPPTA
jgi:hypothetical protein